MWTLRHGNKGSKLVGRMIWRLFRAGITSPLAAQFNSRIAEPARKWIADKVERWHQRQYQLDEKAEIIKEARNAAARRRTAKKEAREIIRATWLGGKAAKRHARRRRDARAPAIVKTLDGYVDGTVRQAIRAIYPRGDGRILNPDNLLMLPVGGAVDAVNLSLRVAQVILPALAEVGTIGIDFVAETAPPVISSISSGIKRGAQAVYDMPRKFRRGLDVCRTAVARLTTAGPGEIGSLYPGIYMGRYTGEVFDPQAYYSQAEVIDPQAYDAHAYGSYEQDHAYEYTSGTPPLPQTYGDQAYGYALGTPPWPQAYGDEAYGYALGTPPLPQAYGDPAYGSA